MSAHRGIASSRRIAGKISIFPACFRTTKTHTGHRLHVSVALQQSPATAAQRGRVRPVLGLATHGIVGYDYRQLEHDSGPTALAGPVKGQVDAIGAGLSYTTVIDKTPFIFNLRHYQEFNGNDGFEGNSTLASATVRF